MSVTSSKKTERDNRKEYLDWKPGIDYPHYMLDRSILTLYNGYLDEGETPMMALSRIADTTAKRLPQALIDSLGHTRESIREMVMKDLVSGDIGPSSPVWSNFGKVRGLPISCFGSYVPDSITGIFETLGENAKMTQVGGGTSTYWGGLRERGSDISHQIESATGATGFHPAYEAMIIEVSQGNRKGSHVVGEDFSSSNIIPMMEYRMPKNHIQKLMTMVMITDNDIDKIYSGDQEALEKWAAIIKTRNATGVPYLIFPDAANRDPLVPWYGKDNGYDLKIKASNLCSEIFLPSNEDESFVCCLLSMNYMNCEEWIKPESTSLLSSLLITEAILDEFIEKASGIYEMRRAVKFAKRHRAVGIGVFGYHSYLKSKNQPFAGWFSTASTNRVFSVMRERLNSYSEKMGEVLGVPEVISQYNSRTGENSLRRHTTLMAVAPTTSNATIAGGWSPGIEPSAGNLFMQSSDKGKFFIIDRHFEKLMKDKYEEYNTEETWKSISDNSGSVQHLEWLDDDDKEVFLTFSEINQFEIVRLAGVRQKYIDQGQSLNVLPLPGTPAQLESDLYLMGHAIGLKSFYYRRNLNIARDGKLLKSSTGSSMDASVCTACEG